MSVDFSGPKDARFRVLDDITFTLNRGVSLVVLGESGSGKTILSRALTNLFAADREPAVGGSVMFKGSDLLTEDEHRLREIRRKEIRYVFQDPAQALNPLATVGTQLSLAALENTRRHEFLSTMLQAVDLPASTLGLFPHQLSVGMAQRVMIAMALIASPKLLIADEPTSSLDVTLRHQVMDVLSGLCKTRDVSLLLITHDLAIARRYGDFIMVLHEGQIVEKSPVKDFFSQPYHPYSRLVQQLQPAIGKSMIDNQDNQQGENSLRSAGCKFSGQCPLVRDRCRVEEPTLENAGDGREVRCFYWR